MFHRTVCVVLLSLLAVASSAVRAEEPDTDMQEMRQQFQQVAMTVVGNMTQKGIDPQQYFGDLRAQMQDGTLDMAALQQKLVDEGLIEQATVDQLQTKAQSATLNSIKRQLGATDEEWAVLLPRIQRVVLAGGDAGGGNPMRAMIAGLFRGKAAKNDVLKAKLELKAVLANPKSKPPEVQTKLEALRDAVQKAKDELAAARKALSEVLTARQEAVLVILDLM